MNRKFRYLGSRDRAEIERLHNRGTTAAVIADKIGAHTATIYRELLSGYERDAEGEPIIDAYGRRVYRADIAQRAFERNSSRTNRTVSGVSAVVWLWSTSKMYPRKWTREFV